jgi:hypothetical protein
MNENPSDTLRTLSLQVREGDGADHMLEARIWAILGRTRGGDDDLAWRNHLPRGPMGVVNGTTLPVAIERFPDDGVGLCNAWHIPGLTTSVDAVEELMGPCEDPFVWSLMTDHGGLRRARVSDADGTATRADAKSPPRALLAAALLAFAARIDKDLPLPDGLSI